MSNISQLQQRQISEAVTIANGAAVSSAINNSGKGARGIAVSVPAAWTAANIAFEVSADNSTWVPLYDSSGARVKISGIATGAAQVYAAPAEAWVCGAWQYMRLVSIDTSTGANANQGAARAMTVVFLQ